jgi:hypothetical protein
MRQIQAFELNYILALNSNVANREISLQRKPPVRNLN